MAQDMKTVYTVAGAEVRSVGPLVGRLFFSFVTLRVGFGLKIRLRLGSLSLGTPH